MDTIDRIVAATIKHFKAIEPSDIQCKYTHEIITVYKQDYRLVLWIDRYGYTNITLSCDCHHQNIIVPDNHPRLNELTELIHKYDNVGFTIRTP